MSNHAKKNLLFFLTYNSLFFVLQLIFIIFKSKSFASTIPLTFPVIVELLLTLSIQIILYSILTIIQTLCVWGWFKNSFRFTEATLKKIILFDTWTALLTANAYFFPLSLYSRTLFSNFPSTLIFCFLMISSGVLLFLILNAVFYFFKQYPYSTTMILGATLLVSFFPTFKTLHTTTQLQPNIIIIGIDSLSPNIIHPHLTPTLYTIRNNSMWFKETISPLARTYPAWSTILTGLHPFHHHARYNLMPQHKTGPLSIAWRLQLLGYETIFATDDRRFNPIDKVFGFQKIIGPKCGANDVLMGTFNDFLLSNLLINTALGQWLFPYNHMNRASYFSYYPQTFSKALQQNLRFRKTNQPLFMATHFTLPHWPYAFASSQSHHVNNIFSLDHRLPLYHTALSAVDTQVADFINTLNTYHLLDNALLIVLSDHGETLYTARSRQTTLDHYQGKNSSPLQHYFANYTNTALDKSAGHGSDLLSMEQYHCFLAIQIYHQQHLITKPKTIHTRIGLQDIAPTILDFLSITQQQMDGISLFNQRREHLPRAFIMESGMLPNQFFSEQNTKQIAQKLFKITQKGFLRVRKDRLSQLDADKLYAVLKGDWILALYPTAQGYLPILQRISTAAWIDNLQTAFAKQSPAFSLLKELETFYHHSFKIISSELAKKV